MTDGNLMAIGLELSEISTDILMYLETQGDSSVRTTDLYTAMTTHSGAGLQKIQDELQQLRLSLLVKTSQDRKDNRTTNVELTPSGQKLLDLGRNLSGEVTPEYKLSDDTINEIGRLLDKEHGKILKVLQESTTIDKSTELYEKATKGNISYRVFQGKVSALITSLFIQCTQEGRKKSFYLSNNGQRYFELKKR